VNNYLKIVNLKFKLYYKTIKNKIFLQWGLGIGDWGLGIGDWAQSPIPNPQSPIPNPQYNFQLNLNIIIFNFKFENVRE
jgi:hypothetical protein